MSKNIHLSLLSGCRQRPAALRSVKFVPYHDKEGEERERKRRKRCWRGKEKEKLQVEHY